MGVSITPGVNQVSVCRKTVEAKEEFVYYLLNKPKGYVTTLCRPAGKADSHVLSSKKAASVSFPVGRLDLDTEGALIMTNDGQLAQKIQHPSNETNKTYEALVRGYPSKEKITLLENGIHLEGKITSPAMIADSCCQKVKTVW